MTRPPAGDTHRVGYLVRLTDVGVSLGGKPVLRGVDLALSPGEAIGITGPNGSGKTTLLRTVATLIPVDRGSGTVLGVELGTAEIYQVRPQIGLIGHIPSLVNELTLAENLEHVARLAGVDGQRVPEVIRTVGLEAASNRRASASSYGMQRRIEAARVLLTSPQILLLDEAMTGLDQAARGLVTALIERTLMRDGGVIVVSHDIAKLREICRSVLDLTSQGLEVAP